MGRFSSFGHHLYEGRISFDFVGRRKVWYGISIAILVLSSLAFAARGFNMGIEFKGGVEFTAKVATADQTTIDDLTAAVEGAHIPEAGDPIASTSGSDAVRVQTKPLTQDQAETIQKALTDAGAIEVSQNLIGPSWGEQVAKKALTGLIVFVLIVVVFIWIYFREWRMSVAAIVALAHDLLITAGVYAWSGFEVTPATVTGLLTILGYSLYDTVVVFDKVKENTRAIPGSLTHTYAEEANLAVNQTLVRSINTAVTALLPVVALLIVGTVVLGTGPLKDLALALAVGMAAGTYSSIFIATPLASQLKEHDASIREHTRRVLTIRAKSASNGSASAESAAAMARRRPVLSTGSAKRRQPCRDSRSARRGG
ncbi:MAG TPA: protein translocase subunit SecF [Aeromicrobium sp.]|nr:protein translocase subunit SecF [Aeromicrobium sp.]